MNRLIAYRELCCFEAIEETAAFTRPGRDHERKRHFTKLRNAADYVDSGVDNFCGSLCIVNIGS